MVGARLAGYPVALVDDLHAAERVAQVRAHADQLPVKVRDRDRARWHLIHWSPSPQLKIPAANSAEMIAAGVAPGDGCGMANEPEIPAGAVMLRPPPVSPLKVNPMPA